ncbi:MAG: hypothetical protein IPH62_19440 [Ignavibacteriae bacterium]|nr:hypothetical protein [Ignavibacteriota bacterium]
MINTTGLEWKEFLNDKNLFNEETEQWIDNFNLYINGSEVDDDFDISIIKDTDVIKIEGGEYHPSSYSTDNDRTDLDVVFKKWKKERNEMCLIIKIKKEDEKLVRELIKKIGNKAKIL